MCWRPLLLLPVMLSACATPHRTAHLASPPVVDARKDWEKAVSPDDARRLAALPATLAAARARAGRRAPALLAAAALAHPEMTPGSYDCRLVRLGAARGVRGGVRLYPPGFCNVRGGAEGRMSFARQTGSDLPGGWLYPDTDRRSVLLAARQARAGEALLSYGVDPARDVVGAVERVGPFRWRLTIPTAAGVDLYELTPVAQAQQAPEPTDS